MRDSLEDAVYNTIHNYRDGKKSGPGALAPKVNMNAGTLNNKADPAMFSHQLTLRESIPIQLTANNFSIAQAYCLALNGVFVQLPDIPCVSDTALLDIWATLIEKEGEFAKAVRESLASGDIDHDEIKNIKNRAQERISVLIEMVKRLESIHHQSVSQHE